MEVTYRKNLNRSYMCIREQGQPVEQYELQMLESYNVPGLLSVQTVISEGERLYLYNISGKQQLEDYLSGKKIGYEMLKRFLISIQQICLSLSEYLLREEGICLEMEFIYVSLDDGSLQFTYLPFYEKSLPGAFAACMEQILRKLDHHDKAAVELGYQIYQLCTRDNADIGGIMEAVLAESTSVIEEAPGNINADTLKNEKRNEIEADDAGESENGCSMRMFAFMQNIKGWQENWKEKRVREEKTVRERFPALNAILSQASVFWREKNAAEACRSKTLGAGGELKPRKKAKSREKRKQREKSKPSEELQVINLSDDADAPSHPTEILSVRQGGTLGKLVYRGVHQCADFQIEGESFLLGKNSRQADGVISAEGVSRLHARVSRKENRYFIEDLNSTNGTYLNEVALEYHEPQELKVNDKVRFGAEEYEFF